jgi:hypothetical protein
MANTQILPFATGVGARVLDAADWDGDSRRTQGFVEGVADPAAVNSAIRQAAFGSAMVAAFTAERVNTDVLDNGDLEAFKDQFVAALLAVAPAPPTSVVLEGTDTGGANAVSVSTLTPNNIVPSAGQVVIVNKSGNANTGAMTANIKGLSGAVTWADGTALASGDWAGNEPAIVRWNGSRWNILSFVGHPVTPETIINQITEGQTYLSGSGVTIDGSNHINLDYNQLAFKSEAGNAFANNDIFSFFETDVNQHRKITWAVLLASVLAQVPTPGAPAPYVQYAGIGTGVGQQIIQLVSTQNDMTPDTWGFTIGMTVSAANLAAGNIQVGANPLMYQVAMNNNSVPASAGLGVASGPWAEWPGLAGTWRLDAWTMVPGWALGFGYPFLMFWRRIA